MDEEHDDLVAQPVPVEDARSVRDGTGEGEECGYHVVQDDQSFVQDAGVDDGEGLRRSGLWDGQPVVVDRWIVEAEGVKRTVGGGCASAMLRSSTLQNSARVERAAWIVAPPFEGWASESSSQT